MIDYLEKLNSKFETNEDKIDTIATLLGCSANFVEFIMKNHKPEDLPEEVLYMIGLTASFVIGLTQDGLVEKVDMSEKTKGYFMGEETGHGLSQVMKQVITEIYNSFQGKGNE